MRSVLLFDLDDTLVVEEAAAASAFAATAQVASTAHELEPQSLALVARERARQLWHASATHPYCRRIGMSSWEGLWCRFEGHDPNVRQLRKWSATYRLQTWQLALNDQGVDDIELARELGERFGQERRKRHETFADAVTCLERLGDTHTLALVTNGACCLQREKLMASGLSEHFELVVISAQLGFGKPDVRIFEHVLSQLDCDAQNAVMIGDSLHRDVDGALAAGLRGVWVNRHGHPRPEDRPDLVEVSALSDLQAALG
ncbi:MAG: HAD family hydrolase [Solirubrobacteraceae bacterium]